ncbi:tail assembly protein [Erwinia sp.]|uniref:tail assembly protein n=1 Tax=Erwinia citreus TaxID=558 RepID=UPI003C744387
MSAFTENDKLITIRLYGALGNKFGRVHQRIVSSPKEAVRALCVTINGFERYMFEAHHKGLTFAIFKGKKNLDKDDLSIGSGDKEIRIIPIPIGSKRAGVFQTVLGVVIIVVAAMAGPAGWGALSASTAMGVGLAGASMAVGGVAQMMAPQQTSLRMREDADNKPSYAFGGPVNTTAQGNPVGLLYGQREIGGAVISAGIFTEDQQ